MNNVKVAYKILLLVVIAFLGMAIIGFRGWSSLSKAGEGMDNMYSKKLQAIRILGDEIDAMRVIQVRTYQAIADPPRATEVVAGAKKQIAKYEKEWAEYETLANAVPEMQGPVKDAKANWDRYRKSMETVMDIASKGQSQEALAEYNRTARKETADLRDKLNNLLKASEENAAKINAENETENRNAIMSMVVITVIAVVILGLLSVMLIKAITSPLTEMIADCVKLKDGDFRMDNRDTSRGDEFGDAQRALFAMRESLNKFMRRIAESSEQIAASSEELTANSSQTAKVAMQVAESVSD
ncbi:MAG: methyl-accepting chemotaxis protein, partial [Schwartzia sp.]|nr:methyl-accepting chemotaxis protein [Schwartzia sp. (in: firmicutes)]